MTEQRKFPRKTAIETLDIFDRITNVLMGRVINITTAGFMMLGAKVLTQGSVYQFDMSLPTPVNQLSKVSFGAEVAWQAETNQNGSYWTGLHIIDISAQDRAVIAELIADWDPCGNC